MSSLPNNEFSESIFEKKILSKVCNSDMPCYIVINNFFVSFETIVLLKLIVLRTMLVK